MRELHPGRLREIKVQLFLKMFVHHVDHSVAKTPKREQEDKEEESESDVASVLDHEHPAPRGMRIHPRGRRGGARFCRHCRYSHSLVSFRQNVTPICAPITTASGISPVPPGSITYCRSG